MNFRRASIEEYRHEQSAKLHEGINSWNNVRGPGKHVGDKRRCETGFHAVLEMSSLYRWNCLLYSIRSEKG
jgi:hypothetical protein